MRVSASRLATLVAERLASVVPPPFEVHAAGADLVVRHPAGWGFHKPFAWVEQDDEEESGATLAEQMIISTLDSIQDAVSEALTEPWPPLSPTGTPRAMAPGEARSDATSIYFWYGHSEQRPTVGFAPIRLKDIRREA
jgi:hypothetical protein